jgi:asparagine synthase (glutamine-hydrolysing)
MEAHLPHDILYRPKMGFSIPLASWFRGPLSTRLRDSVLGPEMADTGLFDMNYLAWLVDQHQSRARDFSAPLWSLLMFQAFQRRANQAS